MSVFSGKLSQYGRYLDLRSDSDDRLRREELIQDLLPDSEDDRLGRVYDSTLAARLGVFMKPYTREFILAVILMSISAIAMVAGPTFIAIAIDDGIKTGNFDTLRFYTALYIITAALSWVTNRWRMRILAIVGSRIVADVRSAMFRHMHTLNLNFYNDYSVGRLMSRLISDVSVLQEFTTWAITGVARALFILVGITIAMLRLNWQLTLVALAVMPFMIWIANIWRKYARSAYIRTRRILSHINGYLNESISGIRVTKSFTREGKNARYFDDLNQSNFESIMEAEFLSAIFFPAIQFFGYFTTALIVIVGGFLVRADNITLGVMAGFALYIGRFFDPIRELARRLNTFQATMAATERIFRLLDTEPVIQDAPNAIELPATQGHIRYNNVHFSYKPDEPILRGISLDARPGEAIALVGETGAGKSTIIRLLSRFFEVTDGSITIDDHDLRDITRASLRSQLGIVLQDTFLFGGTIMDNIRYGRLDATDAEVIQAAKTVGADSFIQRFRDGYQHDVGEDGVNLSVGQRQIISFARAMLANPRILILDEATSSVDTATEKIIQAATETLMANRTSFVIAHRLSTIVKSDKIVVLDAGEIVEVGTHEALLAQKGRYYNLYTMQWQAQTNPEPVEG